jgi:hypothetical protein
MIRRDGDPGVKEGEKSIRLDLQLVVQLIIDIDDCDNLDCGSNCFSSEKRGQD